MKEQLFFHALVQLVDYSVLCSRVMFSCVIVFETLPSITDDQGIVLISHDRHQSYHQLLVLIKSHIQIKI